MNNAEIDLCTVSCGSVTAPAGCGKTELIVKALAAHKGSKPIIVLTHTNAGVAALKSRLNREGIATRFYTLSTIDGWAMRLISTFPAKSGHSPDILNLITPSRDYPAIRLAAKKLLEAGHVNEVIKASYAHLIVDEYQDCSVPQHDIICMLSSLISTCVLGDPMQAIFGFRGNTLVDWAKQVCTHFPSAGELTIPWRWRNAGAESLGIWLLEARQFLATGQSIDLRGAPSEFVTWLQTSPPNDHTQRLIAARTAPPTPNGSVRIIAESRDQSVQRRVACPTPGALTVEAVDLSDLTTFCTTFDITSANALGQILTLAQSVMTNVCVSDLQRRLNSLACGSAINPANEIERAAMDFKQMPTYKSAITLLSKLHNAPSARTYRPAIFHGAIKALRVAATGTHALQEAVRIVREENRLSAHNLPKRAVGSTLLLKGLEAEVAVILNTEEMNAQNLYVAMTRGSMKLVVCSATPILGRRS